MDDDDALTRIERIIEGQGRMLAERLDRVERKVDRMLELQDAESDLEPEANIDDVDEDDFVDSWTASARFNIPIDSIRWYCREKGMGVKEEGTNRWLVSVKALRSYLNSRPS